MFLSSTMRDGARQLCIAASIDGERDGASQRCIAASIDEPVTPR